MKPLELIEQGRFLGEEFLLWLWMQGLTEGGQSGKDGDLSSCFVDDAIVLLSERGEVHRIGLTKGNPAESREAFGALSRGMRPASAKMRILSGDMGWVFTLKAATLEMSGMKMPPTQSRDPLGRISDRLFLVEECAGHMERRYAQFLAERVAYAGDFEHRLHGWVEDGLTGGVQGLDDAPGSARGENA